MKTEYFDQFPSLMDLLNIINSVNTMINTDLSNVRSCLF